MSHSNDKDFYRIFEEAFRGSQEEIRGRLLVYKPFLDPIAAAHPEATAVDLGCGRGEFLGILTEAGFRAVGVDLDEGMLSAARERGFAVVTDDAVTYLQKLPSNTVSVVSGVHIAEHLPFEKLREMTREAWRVLAPGGLLIFETPNPENIVVGSHTFYMDPTHQHPLPPALLKFVVDFEKAGRSTVIRLQHKPGIEERSDPDIRDILFGVSPDYAVVAQKNGNESLKAALETAFTTRYGMDLGELTLRHDGAAKQHSAELEKHLSALDGRIDAQDRRLETQQAQLVASEQRAAVAERRVSEIQVRLETQQAQLVASEQRAAVAERRVSEIQVRLETQQAQLVASEQRAAVAERRVSEIQASTSWRVTAPMRASSRTIRGGTSYIKHLIKRALRPTLEKSFQVVRRHPFLKPFVWAAVARSPRLKDSIIRFVAARNPAISEVILQAHHFPSEIVHQPRRVGLKARSIHSSLHDSLIKETRA